MIKSTFVAYGKRFLVRFLRNSHRLATILYNERAEKPYSANKA